MTQIGKVTYDDLFANENSFDAVTSLFFFGTDVDQKLIDTNSAVNRITMPTDIDQEKSIIKLSRRGVV